MLASAFPKASTTLEILYNRRPVHNLFGKEEEPRWGGRSLRGGGSAFGDVGNCKLKLLQKIRTSFESEFSYMTKGFGQSRFIFFYLVLNTHNKQMFGHTGKIKVDWWQTINKDPLLSLISSFYGLFCKALKIYKIKFTWVVCDQDILPRGLFFRGAIQEKNNHSINFAPFETVLFPPKEEKLQ